jgi:alkylation response protein AidB-like acyl-CoA dehydrogenase
MTESLEYGGQGMPRIVAIAASEYFVGANCSFMMYPSLTHGAGRLVETFGTELQKKLFLKNLYTGKWSGSMLLTEPQAGSDVGALTTSAKKNDDGTYNIVGNKIFISGGEHDLTENIIHPVLARIEGAPAGTKGISLFLVPKIWVNDDGTMGSFNDVVCTGIENKLGIHGNSTCSLALGSKGGCRGLLLGQENRGMRHMFLMMNEARQLVGLQGFGFASCAYLYALNYARERIQGKHILKIKDPDAPKVPIIEHPDIRRQLMTMKTQVEAMRSLIYYAAYLSDQVTVCKDPKEKARCQGLIDILTPIIKAYITDRSFEICSQGIQIFGGYGYIKEYPMEQLLRDCRITMIYEGTNGIQAMDLLGRKMPMEGGKVFKTLLEEIQKTVADAKKIKNLKALANNVEQAINALSAVGKSLGKMAFSGKLMEAFSFSYPLLEVLGDTLMAWMLLWRACIAVKGLNKKVSQKDQAFYEGQILSAQFYIRVLLPVTMGKMSAILNSDDAMVKIRQETFGG